MESLEKGLKARLNSDKIIMLYANTVILIAGYYDDDNLIDSVVILNEPNGWEIVEGEKSRLAAIKYITFFGSLVDMLSDRDDTDELFESELLM